MKTADNRMTEQQIEAAVWKNVAQLGYASAFAVRNVRIGPDQGQVDLALFPIKGKKKVVLVEVKRSTSEEAECKVIGQLIMYLTGALQLSLEGIKLYREYAKRHPGKPRSTNRTTAMQVAGAKSAAESWQIVCDGTPVRPAQIAVYIATDASPGPQVKAALKMLSDHHGLHIGYIQASTRRIEVIRKCP